MSEAGWYMTSYKARGPRRKELVKRLRKIERKVPGYLPG